MTEIDAKIDTSELQDYQPWADDGHDLIIYTQTMITPDLAIGMAKLFWPDFVEYNNGIFLKYRFSVTGYNDWFRELEGDNKAVESIMNYVNIRDLFSEKFDVIGYKNVAFLGYALQQCWTYALQLTYPDRKFDVRGEKDGEYENYIFTFSQK